MARSTEEVIRDAFGNSALEQCKQIAALEAANERIKILELEVKDLKAKLGVI
jgi:hypothetical protein